LRRLSAQDRKSVFKTVNIMRANPHYQSKKMEGYLGIGPQEIFRTRVNDDIRILWRYAERGRMMIIALRVGHHDVLRGD